MGEAQRLLEVCGGESRGCSVGAENLRCVAYYHEYDLNFPTRSPGGSMVKNSPANAGDASSIPGLGRSQGEEMATHSSILAWEILWTEEPGGLQAMGSQRVLT